MAIRILDNVTGAQTSDPVNINPPNATALQNRGIAKTLEAFATGTFTGNTLQIQTTHDSGLATADWISGTAGGSGIKTVNTGKTGACYARVVTTGTGGPYSVDLVISPNY